MPTTLREYTEPKEPVAIRPQFVDYIPNEMEPGILYLAPQWETAVHLCPCGCGNKAVTPLGSIDGWTLTQDGNAGEVVSLHPSLLNSFDCRSHYWIRRNQVVWV